MFTKFDNFFTKSVEKFTKCDRITFEILFRTLAFGDLVLHAHEFRLYILLPCLRVNLDNGACCGVRVEPACKNSQHRVVCFTNRQEEHKKPQMNYTEKKAPECETP